MFRIRLLLVVVIFCAPTFLRADSLTVLPTSLTLTGPTARHKLLLQTASKDGLGVQQREQVTFVSSAPNIAKIEQHEVLAVGNGTANIQALVQGKVVGTVTVKVVETDKPTEISFRNHVLPVLAKAGCSSGACHGALAGKGGFRLSLRGYDPDTDHHTLTRQARSRRIELADPGSSLFLTKPTLAVPHQGGKRLEVGGLYYQVLAGWITQGATGPTKDDAQLLKLEVLPSNVLLKPKQQQQLLVRAHYSSGRVEDVTRWAKFSSADEAVATVDEQGLLTVLGPGEGAVSAWFSSKIELARITVPYANTASSKSTLPARNFIDTLVKRKLDRLLLPESPPATDAEFLRRAFLDTIGMLPTADEARAFLKDPAKDKRDKLIDTLLSRPEFVDYWTFKWSDLLLINGQKLRPEAVKTYYQWIRKNVQQNTPWDQFVREIVTAQGNTLQNGATNFYALHQDPENLVENVSQAFLGLSIGCAKCHNHPLEKWTNDQYYGLANLFARVRGKGWGGDFRSGDGSRTIYVADKGDLIQPLTGKPQPPRALDGPALAFDDPRDRREHLAQWLTSPTNKHFSRTITNRVWANFFGVGLVEAVDDLRDSNPASNEDLLAEAADYLVKQKFDLKALMRVILQSNTYQRSSLPVDLVTRGVGSASNLADKRYYSRYFTRRLMAEVLLDAISQVANVTTDFTEIGFPGADKAKTDFYPKGTRAIQLYDAAVVSPFLKSFGRNQRQITCECERSQEPSMVQVLHLCNGETVNQKLAHKESIVSTLLAKKLSDEQIVEEAYLRALSRFPLADEKKKLVALLATAKGEEHRQAVEDLFWGIVTSREFLFNH